MILFKFINTFVLFLMAYYFRAVVCTLGQTSNVLPLKWNMHLINSRCIRMWSWRYVRPYFPCCPCFHSGAEPRSAAAGLAPGNLAVWWARRGILPLHHAFSLHRDSSFLTCRTTRDQFYVSNKTTQRLFYYYYFMPCSDPQADSQKLFNIFQV